MPYWQLLDMLCLTGQLRVSRPVCEQEASVNSYYLACMMLYAAIHDLAEAVANLLYLLYHQRRTQMSSCRNIASSNLGKNQMAECASDMPEYDRSFWGGVRRHWNCTTCIFTKPKVQANLQRCTVYHHHFSCTAYAEVHTIQGDVSVW